MCIEYDDDNDHDDDDDINHNNIPDFGLQRIGITQPTNRHGILF